MKRKRRDYLALGAEQMALALLFEASGGTIGKIRAPKEGEEKKEINVSFQDRRALLDSVVKLMAKRHDMAPDEPDEPDGIQNYKDILNGIGGESRDRGAGLTEASASLSDADGDS